MSKPRPLTKEEKARFPHVHTVKRRLVDGSIVWHRYYRFGGYGGTGPKIVGEPGTIQFEASYRNAARGTPLPQERSTIRRNYVYFVQCKTLRHIKIGAATTPKKRISEMQVGCPDELELLGVIEDHMRGALERETHIRFAHLHIRGEWFREADDLLAFINEHAFPARITHRRRREKSFAPRAA